MPLSSSSILVLALAGLSFELIVFSKLACGLFAFISTALLNVIKVTVEICMELDIYVEKVERQKMWRGGNMCGGLWVGEV